MIGPPVVRDRPLEVVTPAEAEALRDRPGDGTAPEAAPSVELLPTWRTLADISDDPPPELLLGMFDPDGRTLLYAAPGVGKGSTGAWCAVELQKARLHVAIYDAERRPREWARLAVGFGAAVLAVLPAGLLIVGTGWTPGRHPRDVDRSPTR